MILGTTNSPNLVAGIIEINAQSAREAAYKSRIAQLEEALADATGTLDMYRAVCGITLDDCERLRKMVAEDVHLISKSYRVDICIVHCVIYFRNFYINTVQVSICNLTSFDEHLIIAVEFSTNNCLK